MVLLQVGSYIEVMIHAIYVEGRALFVMGAAAGK